MVYVDDVISQMREKGLLPDANLTIGELKRCKEESDKGSKLSGWYVLHYFQRNNGEQRLVGCYGNWKVYGEKIFKVELKEKLEPDEIERYKKQSDEIKAKSQSEKDRRNEDAAKRAAYIWKGLPAFGQSPYLQAKKVAAMGIRYSRGSIVVPVAKITGELTGLQFIYPDGSKKFLTGTAKRGAFHIIGNITPHTPLCIAEGYATGVTIHMATGWPVAIAFDAGNLEPVAIALRTANPNQDMIICADDDSGTKDNPGVTKAKQAAARARCAFCIPVFTKKDEAA